MELSGVDALHHACQALQASFGRCVVAAGIHKIETVNTPAGLSRVRLRQQKTAVGTVGGIAADALIDRARPSGFRRLAVRFRNPAAVEGMHPVFARQIDAEAHQLVEGHGPIAAVFQHGAAGKGRLEYPVVQMQAQPMHRVKQHQLQRLSVSGLGQAAGDGNAALMNLEGFTAKIRGNRTSLHGQFHGAFAVISAPRAAPVQRKHIQTAGVAFFVVQNAVSPAESRPYRQGVGILQRYRLSEMELLQKALRARAEQIGRGLILKMKYAVSLLNHRISYASFATYSANASSVTPPAAIMPA